MANFTAKDLLHVAELARLEIPPSDIPKRLEEFNEIVGYIEKLDSLNTQGIEPTFQLTPSQGIQGTPMGADQPEPSLPTDKVVQNAPKRQDAFFVVPRMIGD